MRNRKGNNDGTQLTVADLVVMSLLSEAPMHGYAINAELERRHVGDWAQVSRAQIYYSVDKLERLGLAASSPPTGEGDDPRGKNEVRLTGPGETAFREALTRDDWCSDPAVPRFITWLAVSKRLSPKLRLGMLSKRRDFLIAAIAREEGTIPRVKKVGLRERQTAKAMMDLTIRLYRTEMEWIEETLEKNR